MKSSKAKEREISKRKFIRQSAGEIYSDGALLIGHPIPGISDTVRVGTGYALQIVAARMRSGEKQLMRRLVGLTPDLYPVSVIAWLKSGRNPINESNALMMDRIEKAMKTVCDSSLK